MKNFYVLLLISSLSFASCSVNHLDPLETAGYAPQSEGIYYTIVMLGHNIPNQEVVIIKNKIVAFNQSQGASKEKLRPSAIYLNSDDEVNAVPVITIRRFETNLSAKQYASSLKKFLKKNTPKDSAVYPIAQMNYRNLIRRQDVEEFKRYHDLGKSSD